MEEIEIPSSAEAPSEVRGSEASGRLAGASEWGRTIEGIRTASPFHANAWIEAAAAHTGAQVLRWMMLSGEEPIGGCPLYLMRRRGLRLLASPAPGSSAMYSGPVWKDLDALKESTRLRHLEALADDLDDLAARARAQVIMLRLAPESRDVRPFLWRGYSPRIRYTYRVRLDRAEDDLLGSFSRTARQLVRKAASVFRIREGAPEDGRAIFDLLRRRFEAQGLRTVLSKAYIDSVLRGLGPGRSRVLVAERDSRLSNAIVTLSTDVREYWWIGFKGDDTSAGSSELLLWEAMRRARGTGKTSFELIGAEDPRLIEFKAKFNPDLWRCYELVRGRGLGRPALLMRRRTRSD